MATNPRPPSLDEIYRAARLAEITRLEQERRKPPSPGVQAWAMARLPPNDPRVREAKRRQVNHEEEPTDGK